MSVRANWSAKEIGNEFIESLLESPCSTYMNHEAYSAEQADGRSALMPDCYVRSLDLSVAYSASSDLSDAKFPIENSFLFEW